MKVALKAIERELIETFIYREYVLRYGPIEDPEFKRKAQKLFYDNPLVYQTIMAEVCCILSTIKKHIHPLVEIEEDK